MRRRPVAAVFACGLALLADASLAARADDDPPPARRLVVELWEGPPPAFEPLVELDADAAHERLAKLGDEESSGVERLVATAHDVAVSAPAVRREHRGALIGPDGTSEPVRTTVEVARAETGERGGGRDLVVTAERARGEPPALEWKLEVTVNAASAGRFMHVDLGEGAAARARVLLVRVIATGPAEPQTHPFARAPRGAPPSRGAAAGEGEKPPVGELRGDLDAVFDRVRTAPNETLRRQGMREALALLGRDDAPALRGVLESDPSEHVRRLAVKALGKLAGAGGDAELEPIIEAIRSDPDQSVRLEAIHIVRNLRHDPAAPLLIEIVAKDPGTLRIAAMGALRAMGRTDYAPALVSALDNEATIAGRIAILKALGSIGGEAELPAVAAVEKSATEAPIKAAAAVALYKIQRRVESGREEER